MRIQFGLRHGAIAIGVNLCKSRSAVRIDFCLGEVSIAIGIDFSNHGFHIAALAMMSLAAMTVARLGNGDHWQGQGRNGGDRSGCNRSTFH